MTDEDGMRLGELEGIVGEEDGYTAESDAAILLAGSRHPGRTPRAQDERAAGRPEGARAAGAGAVRQAAGTAAGRAHELSGSRFHPLAAGFPRARYEGTLIAISHDRHFLNSVCTHIADIDYETIITYTGGYDDMVLRQDADPLASRVAKRAAREEDRATERIHRALLCRHALEPGNVTQERS